MDGLTAWNKLACHPSVALIRNLSSVMPALAHMVASCLLLSRKCFCHQRCALIQGDCMVAQTAQRVKRLLRLWKQYLRFSRGIPGELSSELSPSIPLPAQHGCQINSRLAFLSALHFAVRQNCISTPIITPLHPCKTAGMSKQICSSVTNFYSGCLLTCTCSYHSTH